MSNYCKSFINPNWINPLKILCLPLTIQMDALKWGMRLWLALTFYVFNKTFWSFFLSICKISVRINSRRLEVPKFEIERCKRKDVCWCMNGDPELQIILPTSWAPTWGQSRRWTKDFVDGPRHLPWSDSLGHFWHNYSLVSKLSTKNAYIFVVSGT